MTKRIVILGTGITSVTAIKAIREIDLDSEIYLMGQEKFYPYNRVKLSKGLFDNLEENSILLQKKEWYEQNKVKIFINTKVVNINTDRFELILCDGSKVKYDKLLIATGSSNNIPPIDGIGKDGVYTLRSLNDALNIKNSLNESAQVIIIGGGIQGLEMAWIVHQHGKKATIIELQSRLMPYQLDNKASEILRDIIQGYGIEILTNTGVVKITGDTKVASILIDKEVKLKCDMVIYSTGIKANKELISNTKVETVRGIVVNNKMETNIKNIYAAGDIAQFDNKVIGLWNIAIAQGKVAGYNIAGKETVYENITPVTTLNAFGISLFSMGCVDESESTKVLLDEDVNFKIYRKIFIKNNKVIGAIVIGDMKRSPLLKSAIEKGIKIGDVNLSVDELLDKLKNNK
ncbi:FAD-dependent oxidoreductase [Clostridium tagluense]|uniref:NAD(P)/FAD-dependent oxidoreductase n=1 Tax=Clostridium tagluense TaxID=360422 RepID=UPI001CF30484|nr:FAD-dependent oxidoreductase [Clostridium tagluense]MCB2309720.1 FAD-dependent oxidoreductase [Clostridium tagluense]MCB2314750.1 FAD-dependent oxidoreductase [Clostridium tagluense]MCB2319599.1 FAD-dependent oxidoreductase [Clostridium tagluense]MCB2324314.1 FAD-dependent oxidoreductase [Clostridium tagluense]MCB2329165.1 FAD-dependent oxidoreductase [Clostridium tagluense]